MSKPDEGAWIYLLLLGASLMVFAIAFPPFSDAASIDLSLHMVEHILILVSGALVSYSLVKKGTLHKVTGQATAGASLISIAFILAFWHLPAPWDAAALNPVVHVLEHIAFFGAGFLIGASLLLSTDVVKITMLTLGLIAHTAYAIILTSGNIVYPIYSIAQQDSLGLLVYAMDPIFTGLIVLLLLRPDGNKSQVQHVRVTWISKAISLTLVVVLLSSVAAFYVVSAKAVLASSPPQGSRALVIIQETPLSWQYSPQNLTVVIGVNNTVTWLSRSLAYDTVTGENGTFSSGQLGPGASYTHTFTAPGTYLYHCQYHPWMTGSVKVLSA